MSDIQNWDPAAINNQQPAPDGWPETTMVVSQINDAGRELMAAVARWYLDTNGSLVSAGTGAAYTVTPNRTIAAYFDGLVLTFEAHLANTGAATLQVGALPAKSMRTPDDAVLTADFISAGSKVTAVFDASRDRWQVMAGSAGVMTAPLRLVDGTVALPGLQFGTDTDTGIRRAAANDMHLVTAGVSRLGIGSSGVVTLFNSILDIPEIGTPANPAANVARLYAADDAGVTALFVKNSAGTISGILPVAVQADMEAAASLTRTVTPGRQHFHPGHPKAWAFATGSTGGVLAGYNVSGVTDLGTGRIVWNFVTPFSSNNYAVVCSGDGGGANAMHIIGVRTRNAGNVELNSISDDGGLEDPVFWSFAVLGDQ